MDAVSKEISMLMFGGNNREMKAGFGSAVMRWCVTQQVVWWTRREGSSVPLFAFH